MNLTYLVVEGMAITGIVVVICETYNLVKRCLKRSRNI